MKWFKHDSDAHIDAKLEKLIMEYGAEGYGIYWYCLELISGKLSAEKITFELEHDAEIIGHRMKVDQIKVENIMKFMIKLGLFSQSNENIFCYALAKRIESSMAKNPQLKDIIDNIKSNPGSSGKFREMSAQTRLEENRLDKNTIYGEFKNVSLSTEEYEKLVFSISIVKTMDMIERLGAYKKSKGKRYKSDYATILNWLRRDKKSGTYDPLADKE